MGMDDDDEMGDFIVEEGAGGAGRNRRRKGAMVDIPGVSAAMLEVREPLSLSLSLSLCDPVSQRHRACIISVSGWEVRNQDANVALSLSVHQDPVHTQPTANRHSFQLPTDIPPTASTCSAPAMRSWLGQE